MHSLVRTQTFRAGIHDIGTTVLTEGFQEFLNPEHTPQLLAKLAEDAMSEPDVRNLLAAAPAHARPFLEETIRKMFLHPAMHEKLRQMIWLEGLSYLREMSILPSRNAELHNDDCRRTEVQTQ